MTVHGIPSHRAHVASHDGERTFGRELCRRHGAALTQVAWLLLGDDDAVDDVVSDTIAAACRLADRPDRHDVTRVHLARSVYHRCLGRLATYERFAFRAGRVAAHHRGLRNSVLSDDQRAAVALVVFGGHDRLQAADTLNLLPVVVTRHLRDAASTLTSLV